MFMLMKAANFNKKDINLSVFGVFPLDSSDSDILKVFTENEKVMQVLSDGDAYELNVRDVVIVSNLCPEYSEDFDISKIVFH